MKESIFTKIAKREIPAYIVDENEEFMAFLDIYPATYGQTLVVPKEWRDSYLFNNDDEFIIRFVRYIKQVSMLLDKKLGSERCRLFFEGLAVNHLHAKLYPVFDLKEGDTAFDPRNKIEFNDKIAKEILGKLNS